MALSDHLHAAECALPPGYVRTGGGTRPGLRWRSASPLSARAARRHLRHLALLRQLSTGCGVAPIDESGIDDDGHAWFSVGPYLATVAARMADGPPPLAETAAIMDVAGRAVAALHTAGLTAGEVSPGRLLVDSAGGVHLAPPTADADVDPAYAAPELLRGTETSPESDQYGLAATAFALLHGAPPFGADSSAALRALTQPAPRIDRPDLPADVVDVIARALAAEPARRPSVAEIGSALRQALPPPPSPGWPGAARVDTLPPAVSLSNAGQGATQPDLGAGEPLGSRYLLVSEIGRGATGRVWRAVHRDDGTAVAAKVLRAEYVGDPETVIRFLRQRTVLAALHHPHLVRVHDLVAEGDVLAVIMDLVDGSDLRSVLRQRRLTTAQMFTMLSQVADALSAMHRAGVVHRDIKPENIIIRWDEHRPHALVTDLGLAKVMDAPQLTQSSVLHGTPGYVAPELLSGLPAQPATDVYGLGIIAYEALAGVRPFRADNTAAVLRMHLETAPERPDGLPEEHWRVVRACLAKDPADRPTAATLSGQLALLAGPTGTPVPPDPHEPAAPYEPDEPAVVPAGPAAAAAAQWTIGATRPAPPAPSEPERRRHRWRWVAVGSVLAVAAAAAGVWSGWPQEPPPPVTVTPTPTPTGPPLYKYFLHVTATSPRPGVVRLSFPDASTMPGFGLYVVYQDPKPNPIDHFPARPGVPPYEVEVADRSTVYCYRVEALIETDNPPPPINPGKACTAANGKPTE